MHIVGRIALGLLLLPLAEIAVFLLVGSAIGFGNALLLLLLMSGAGWLVLRTAGRSHVQQFRSSISQGITISSTYDGASFFTVLAGFLLLLPGFITGTLGVVLLLPGARQLLRGVIGRHQRTRTDVVDLDPDQWQRHPQPTLPPKDRGTPPDL